MRRYLAGLLVFLPGLAAAQDPQQGHALARRWCSSCHLIDRLAAQGRADGVPSFPAISAKPGTSASTLRSSLTGAHTRMPDFSLSNRDQNDLIAYILSLR